MAGLHSKFNLSFASGYPREIGAPYDARPGTQREKAANIHHRHDGSRRPVRFVGVHTRAEPRYSIDPRFLRRVGQPLPLWHRTAAIGPRPGGEHVAAETNSRR